jgi:hypothetical protein
MCWGHYQRWLRYGHPLGTPAPRDRMALMWERITKQEVGCWLYDGVDMNRRPRWVDRRGRRRPVKDIVWEEANEPLRGRRLRPLCGSWNCVRPDHFELLARSRKAA